MTAGPPGDGKRKNEKLIAAQRATELWQALQSAQTRVNNAERADERHDQEVANQPAEPAGPDPYRSDQVSAAHVMSQAQQEWDHCVGQARGLRDQLMSAIRICVSAINKAKGTRFKENPKWYDIGGQFTDFVRDNADLLKKLSGALKIASLVAGLLSFIPILAPICGPIALGSALLASAIDLSLYAATGEGSLKTILIDVGLNLLPGVGKLARLGMGAMRGTKVAMAFASVANRGRNMASLAKGPSANYIFVVPLWPVIRCQGVITEKALAGKLATVRPHLDEKQWRLLLGAEAEAIGWGGIGLVARLSGVSRTTVQVGVAEVRAGVVPDGRVRAPGAGRPAVEEIRPGIEQALEGLVDPESRGDPMSPLKWTTKSLTQLVKGLYANGFTVGRTTVARLLKQAGYRLQRTFKTKEGAQHPDRDAQFRHINATAEAFLADGDPVVSVDAKKKELVGEYANGGREWHVAGQPVEVNGHDFPAGVPKAIPYGVYDIGADSGFVSVGVDHETSPFAVNAIRTWWRRVGRKRYHGAKRLLVTADGGGSNGYRRRAWKVELAKLAAETGLDITVCHFPPGTSKWTKVEHRLFSFISINWRGRPLTDYQVIVETIAATTTKTGLTVEAVLDPGTYPAGVEVSKAQVDAVPLTRQQFHGEWNYTVHSGPITDIPQNKTSSMKSTK